MVLIGNFAPGLSGWQICYHLLRAVKSHVLWAPQIVPIWPYLPHDGPIHACILLPLEKRVWVHVPILGYARTRFWHLGYAYPYRVCVPFLGYAYQQEGVRIPCIEGTRVPSNRVHAYPLSGYAYPIRKVSKRVRVPHWSGTLVPNNRPQRTLLCQNRVRAYPVFKSAYPTFFRGMHTLISMQCTLFTGTRTQL